MTQMHADARKPVGAQRTMRAARCFVRMKHEVIDDELTAAVEQIGQGLPSRRTVEDVLLGYALPRQAALQSAHLLGLARERFFFLEERAARRQPFFVRNDRMIHNQIVNDCHNTHPSIDVLADSPAAADAPLGEPKIYHATLKIGNAMITGADVPPDLGWSVRRPGRSLRNTVDHQL